MEKAFSKPYMGAFFAPQKTQALRGFHRFSTGIIIRQCTGQTHLDFSASKFPLKEQALKKKITAKSKKAK
jgi:hypothetical protein